MPGPTTPLARGGLGRRGGVHLGVPQKVKISFATWHFLFLLVDFGKQNVNRPDHVVVQGGYHPHPTLTFFPYETGVELL